MKEDAPVVLIGMMGSGKSTVGPLLAARLGWTFLDTDRVIEDREGATIAEIFARGGEGAFRRLEQAVVGEALRRRGVVVATGGGWALPQAVWDALPPGVRTVWLRVRPETVQRRLAAERGVAERPLLAGSDPFRRIVELVESRGSAYARADHAVDTDDESPAVLAGRIEALLKESL